MKLFRSLLVAVGLTALPIAALAQSTTVDQIPAPVPSSSNGNSNSEWLLQNYGISGGTIYQSFMRQPGSSGRLLPGGMLFVPSNQSGTFTHWLSLTDARFDSGITGAASGASGTGFNIARTAGTSYDLTGVATSSSAVTTKFLFETDVASTYVAGSAIPVVVNANYTGSGTITAASTTLTLNAYTEVGGVETAITGITAAQQFNSTPANYTFNIPSTAGLVPGQHIALELVMLVTTASGANTGQLNAIGHTD